MNILIVDDNKESRCLLESLFNPNEHIIRSAKNGAEAIEILEYGEIDLIISDILMPVMDGFKLCCTVKTNEKWHTIPFIFYTATYTDSEDEEFVSKIGADRFLVKPCEPEYFLKAVEEVMATDNVRGTDEIQTLGKEGDVYSLYNERLVRNIEQKLLKAQHEIQTLQFTEKALRESKERLIKTQRIAKMGSFTWNIETGAVIWSDAVFDLLGYEKSEIIDFTKVNSEIHHPEDRAYIEKWFQECIQSDRPQHGPKEYRLVRKDGSALHIQAFVALKYNKGKPVEIFGIVQDITGQKQAEHAKEESEMLFRNVFQEHVAIKLIIDPGSGRIVDANRAASKFYGWSQDQLREMRIQQINTLSDEKVQEEMEKARSQKRVYFEFRHRRADGSIRNVEVRSSRIEVKGKVFLHSIVHDITKRIQAERALQESKETLKSMFLRQEALLAAIPDIIVEVDVDKIYKWANQAGFEFFGEDLIGRKASYYFEGEQRTYDTVQPLFNGCEDVIYVESWQRRRDGEKRLLAWWCRVLKDAHGKVTGALSSARDITQQVKLSARLQQAEKMESVGRLAGGVAHDYNNMLSIILGYTEMALEKIAPSDPLHSDLIEIFSAAKRSAEITRQLLAFARKQTIAPKVIDLSEVVVKLLKMLRRLIGEDINIAWKPESPLWHVKIDPSQIEQVLVNLCINARDAIGGVGNIIIETHTVTLDKSYCIDHVDFVPGEFVFLVVSDDGCGMDKNILENIFEPFFTTKGLSKGTGLGLATVYGIVKQNNGFINVYSEPGKGTSFKIYLPRCENNSEEVKTDTPEEILTGNGEMILLVEDEPAMRNMAQRMLRRLEYQVLPAASPGEALRLIKEYADKTRLLITDVVMPEMNGRELADRLEEFCPDLKTIFMSGYTANVIAHREVLEDGMVFLQKPFSIRDLALKIKEILG